MKRNLYILVLLTGLASPAAHAAENPFASDSYQQVLKKLTDVMVNDVTSPVAAARYYAYTTLAGYELLAACGIYPSLSEALNGLSPAPVFPESVSLDISFAVLYVTFHMGERLLPSGYLLEDEKEHLTQRARANGLSSACIRLSIEYAGHISDHIMEYVASDGYSGLSALTRYTPLKGPAYWVPTPPAYIPAIEPHWNKLRPFLLESPGQFRPDPPAPYSEEAGSVFQQLVMDVYNTCNNLSSEQLEIGSFWDCNPFVLHTFGHMDFGMKKISPGAHWMGITGIACLQQGLSFEATVRTHALTALAISDAFIACWDEKYRSNRVRPETVINRLVDPGWTPLLQTPPFPEYVSGHSVISTTAASVLTELFGEHFAYTDTVEVEYGLPPRSFGSFTEAAEEAAISRLYGGIHYRDAIDEGVRQGRELAEYIIREKYRKLRH